MVVGLFFLSIGSRSRDGLRVVYACLALWVAQVERDIDLEEPAVQTPEERLEHSSVWHKVIVLLELYWLRLACECVCVCAFAKVG